MQTLGFTSGFGGAGRRVLGGGVRERWGGRLEPVQSWVSERESSAELGAFLAFFGRLRALHDHALANVADRMAAARPEDRPTFDALLRELA